MKQPNHPSPKGVNTMTGINGKEFEIVDSPVPKEFELIDKYWKASNYLAVGQVRPARTVKDMSSNREYEH
jgi:phosphoketolase